MPKDPKRNIQSYQLQGGHLNEFEFQKSQSAMAEESELPFTDERDNPNLNQAKHVADVTAEAHEKVEERRRRGLVKTGSARRIAAGKRSAKKATRKSATKKATRKSATKTTTRKSATRRTARKSATKTTTGAKAKKRASVKMRRPKRAASR